jgi:NADH:ubiquinone oxidoreductase subunit 3 (subunit A)
MIKYVGYVIMFVLFIDVLGFVAWATSGQKPVDSFHAGAITENIIRVVTK